MGVGHVVVASRVACCSRGKQDGRSKEDEAARSLALGAKALAATAAAAKAAAAALAAAAPLLLALAFAGGQCRQAAEGGQRLLGLGLSRCDAGPGGRVQAVKQELDGHPLHLGDLRGEGRREEGGVASRHQGR